MRSEGDASLLAFARFARFAWVVVGVNLAVVLWGALVRATGSGAGCGSHWPLCNGQVVPIGAAQATAIEFGHRLLSGVALVMVGVLWIRAGRRFETGHPVRGWASASLGLILVEALIGAGLVRLGWVGEDVSLGRAISIPVHLGVTFALLACLAMAAWRSTHPPGPRLRGGEARTVALLLGGSVLVGMTGALTALGDTLFPSESLGAGLAQDFASESNWMVRLRFLHPLLAILVASAILLWARSEPQARPGEGEPARRWLGRFVLAQLAVGLANVLLLAPVWIQLVHLLMADLVWILLVVAVAGSGTAVQRSASKIS